MEQAGMGKKNYVQASLGNSPENGESPAFIQHSKHPTPSSKE
jgi:hypothetical protein